MVLNAGFTQLGYYFQTYGIMDFLLPFLLVFTIIFAVMQKTKILGEKKNFNVIVALVLAYFSFEPVYLSDNSMNNLSEQITEISVLERTSVLVNQEFNNKKDFLAALKENLELKRSA